MEAQKVKLLQERDIRFQQASYHPRDVYFRNPFLCLSVLSLGFLRLKLKSYRQVIISKGKKDSTSQF